MQNGKPTTLEEARAKTYGAWAGNPKGNKYCEGYCVEAVSERVRWQNSHQCCRANGFGLGNLYCKQHAVQFEAGKTWWEAETGGIRIEPVKIQRATDDYVWIAGNRRQKYGQFYSYHPTWEDARSHLVRRAERDEADARRKLDAARERKAALLALQEPKE